MRRTPTGEPKNVGYDMTSCRVRGDANTPSSRTQEIYIVYFDVSRPRAELWVRWVVGGVHCLCMTSYRNPKRKHEQLSAEGLASWQLPMFLFLLTNHLAPLRSLGIA